MGVIEVLATGKGHDEIALGENGAENKTKVDDLLGKKYLLTVAVGEGEKKQDKKVTSFDSDKNELVCEETVTEKKELRVPATTAKVTAVAPLAGG